MDNWGAKGYVAPPSQIIGEVAAPPPPPPPPPPPLPTTMFDKPQKEWNSFLKKQRDVPYNVVFHNNRNSHFATYIIIVTIPTTTPLMMSRKYLIPSFPVLRRLSRSTANYCQTSVCITISTPIVPVIFFILQFSVWLTD